MRQCLQGIGVMVMLLALLSLVGGTAPPGTQDGLVLIAQKKAKKKPAPAKEETKKEETKKEEPKKEEPKSETPKKEEAKKEEKPAPATDKPAAPKDDDEKLVPRDDRDRALALINRQPPEKRGKALAILDMKDQDRLAKTALADSDALARHTAVYVLTDQKLLAKVAWETRDEMIRITAASRITGADQESIVKMFDKPVVGGVRGLVFSKLKDPPTLARIAMGPDTLGSLQAANRLVGMHQAKTSGVTDKMLDDIALGATHEAPRRAAMRAVTNQDVLAKAAEDPERKVREAATARLKELRSKAK